MSKLEIEAYPYEHKVGRRMNRIIRLLETLIKKEKDTDRVVKLANSLCYITSKKLELAFKRLQLEEIFKAYETKQKEDWR